MSYEIRLDVYEGPFDVLLTLISERRVDVCDVPIARLTEDYLAHLELMRDMDLEVTTEFLVVAATLLQLKARALLPVPALEEAQAEDMERDVLIARLLEVRTFQSVGALLAEWLADGDRYFPAAPAADDPALRVLPTLAGILAGDLGRALAAMLLDRTRPVDTSTLVSDEVSADEAAALVVSRVAAGPTSFREIVRGLAVGWAIAVFLAILELSMRGEVLLGQAERLGDITVMGGFAPHGPPERQGQGRTGDNGEG